MSFRPSSSFACFSLAISLAACGGSTSAGDGTTDDTGSAPADTSGADGATIDTGTKPDGTSGDGTATDTTTPPGDGSGTDTASSGDTAGVTCGASTCKTGDVCCVTPKDGGADQVCAASCGDGGIPLACDGPEDCPTGAAKICCATLKVGAGSPPACPFDSGNSACTATCPTRIPFSCPGEGKVRLCHTKADCADDTSNPSCCTFSGGGGTGTFCAPDAIKGFATSCAP